MWCDRLSGGIVSNSTVSGDSKLKSSYVQFETHYDIQVQMNSCKNLMEETAKRFMLGVR